MHSSTSTSTSESLKSVLILPASLLASLTHTSPIYDYSPSTDQSLLDESDLLQYTFALPFLLLNDGT